MGLRIFRSLTEGDDIFSACVDERYISNERTVFVGELFFSTLDFHTAYYFWVFYDFHVVLILFEIQYFSGT